jgi:serine/threonine-protein kinase RsbW
MASVMESGRRASRRRWRRPSRATTIPLGTAVEPEMELTLPARAESLAIVRDALRALGGVLALEHQVLADICLAVTEACTNVVLHAYPDGEDGPLEILVWNGGAHTDDARAPRGERMQQAAPAEEELTVIVGDCGRGTHAPASSPGLGLGLRLISALTKSARVSSNEEGRTEVEMTFSLVASSPSEALSMSNATAAPR